jgi:hypothetical protein
MSSEWRSTADGGHDVKHRRTARRHGPDVALSVAVPLKARVCTDGTHAVVGDVIAVGWNRSNESVYVDSSALEYLVFDPEAGDLAWFASSEVLSVLRGADERRTPLETRS